MSGSDPTISTVDDATSGPEATTSSAAAPATGTGTGTDTGTGTGSGTGTTTKSGCLKGCTGSVTCTLTVGTQTSTAALALVQSGSDCTATAPDSTVSTFKCGGKVLASDGSTAGAWTQSGTTIAIQIEATSSTGTTPMMATCTP